VLLDGLLILAPEMSEPLRVSTPGEVLWAMLAEPCTVADLLAVWSEIYDIPVRSARADIESVLDEWYDGGAVVVARQSR
jgi:hypothetical protein